MTIAATESSGKKEEEDDDEDVAKEERGRRKSRKSRDERSKEKEREDSSIRSRNSELDKKYVRGATRSRRSFSGITDRIERLSAIMKQRETSSWHDLLPATSRKSRRFPRARGA